MTEVFRYAVQPVPPSRPGLCSIRAANTATTTTTAATTNTYHLRALYSHRHVGGTHTDQVVWQVCRAGILTP